MQVKALYDTRLKASASRTAVDTSYFPRGSTQTVITSDLVNQTQVWYKLAAGWVEGKFVEIVNNTNIKPIVPESDYDKTRKKNDQDKKNQDTVKNAPAVAAVTKPVTTAEVAAKVAPVAQGGGVDTASSTYDYLSPSDRYKEGGSLGIMSGLPIPRFRMIHGLPFQFLSSTDRKINNGGVGTFGRMYTREILSNIPVVTFVPGVPSFLTGLGDKDKNQFLSILSDVSDTAVDELSKGLNKSLQYYTLKASRNDYFHYVNSFLNTQAILMKIGDYEIDGVPLYRYDWEKFNSELGNGINTKAGVGNIISALGIDDGVAFAYDPEGSINTSGNNSTGESAIASKTKGISQMAREAEFLLGAGAGKEFEYTSDEFIETQIPKMADVRKYDPNNMLSRVWRQGATLATGANLLFPEIWNDSSFVKDYQVNLRFESPYAHPLARFFAVAVPFAHIFCLAGPRSYSENSYVAPFLIKAFSKGYFDVQLGMIDSISIKKFGDGDQMADDMVPMSMEVSVNFKDLYQALTITSVKNEALFYNNTGLLEMLGTNSGVSLQRQSIVDRLSLIAKLKFGKVTNIPGNIVEQLRDSLGISETARKIFGTTIDGW